MKSTGVQCKSRTFPESLYTPIVSETVLCIFLGWVFKDSRDGVLRVKRSIFAHSRFAFFLLLQLEYLVFANSPRQISNICASSLLHDCKSTYFSSSSSKTPWTILDTRSRFRVRSTHSSFRCTTAGS